MDQPDLLSTAHFVEIGIINQLSTTAFERVLPHGLTVAQFGLLNHMVRLGDGWGPARLAAAFQVTKAAMTGLVTKLEAKDFVAIEADPHDRRAKRVLLTDAGRAAREDAQHAAGPLFARLRDVLTQDEAAALLNTLQTIRTWLDENR